MAIEFPWITTTFGDVRSINALSDKMTGLTINYKDNLFRFKTKDIHKTNKR